MFTNIPYMIPYIALSTLQSHPNQYLSKSQIEVLKVFLPQFKGVNPTLSNAEMPPERATEWAISLTTKLKTNYNSPSQIAPNSITGQQFTSTEIDCIKSACINHGEAKVNISLLDYAELTQVSNFKTEPYNKNDTGWIVSRPGIDTSGKWAIVTARYGKIFGCNGIVVTIFHYSNGKWLYTTGFANHAL